ncbi:unnamed protein product, partial [Owenia fusiformis]
KIPDKLHEVHNIGNICNSYQTTVFLYGKRAWSMGKQIPDKLHEVCNIGNICNSYQTIVLYGKRAWSMGKQIPDKLHEVHNTGNICNSYQTIVLYGKRAWSKGNKYPINYMKCTTLETYATHIKRLFYMEREHGLRETNTRYST